MFSSITPQLWLIANIIINIFSQREDEREFVFVKHFREIRKYHYILHLENLFRISFHKY